MSQARLTPSEQNLLDAVEKNDLSAVQRSIGKECSVDVRDKGGSTPLMRAALHGYNELLTLLIASGADVNLKDNAGRTALHYASQEHHEEVVRKLLDARADVNSQDKNGNSPLSIAVFYSQGRGSIIKALRERGADDNLPNKHGVTPLALATRIANYDVVKHFGG